MKISKYFMVAAASIMMFGCAKNDENNGPHFDGPIALSIKVATPELNSKAAVDPTSAVAVDWDEATVTLYAENGEQTATLQNNGEKSVTFWNVENPTKVTVSINDGKATYTNLDDFYVTETDDAIEAIKVPVYGETAATDFTYAGTIEGTDENTGKSYNLYRADVMAMIPVARLELSGIKHAAHEEGEDCWYSAITFDKIEVLNAPSGATFEDGAFTATADVKNLEETIPAEGNDFKTYTFPDPESNKCYAFNMFSSKQQPTLRFTFKRTADGEMDSETAYAVVKKFVNTSDDSEITTFAAGHVYQIKSIVIEDESITPDPAGNTLVAVTVYVTVQDWNLVNTSVEF